MNWSLESTWLLLCAVGLSISQIQVHVVRADFPEVDDSDLAPRLSKGQIARPGQFPSFAIIAQGKKDKERPTFKCLGAWIGGKVILTTATCVNDYLEESKGKKLQVAFTVYPVSHWKQKGVKTYKISRVCQSSDYVPDDPTNDYAVLILKEHLDSGRGVSPVRLSGKKLTEFDKTIAVGLSYDDQQRKDAKALQFAPVTYWKRDNPVAGFVHRGSSSCENDLGGPIYRLEDGDVSIVSVLSKINEKPCSHVVEGIDVHKLRDKIETLMNECPSKKKRCLKDGSKC